MCRSISLNKGAPVILLRLEFNWTTTTRNCPGPAGRAARHWCENLVPQKSSGKPRCWWEPSMARQRIHDHFNQMTVRLVQ
jgi:hypothetical protein